MSEHRAELVWLRGDLQFTYETYSRDHVWTFDGGPEVAASAAPAYRGSPGRVDPEEALVASIASCHMLTFLAIAARKRFSVRSYRDSAVGHLEKNEQGRLAITRVELSPRIEFDGAAPDARTLEQLHEASHEQCFIANSVRTTITVNR